MTMAGARQRILCDGCGKCIGYYKDTGRTATVMNLPLVELIKTHMTTKEEMVNPRAKLDKYKYEKVTRCDYCNRKVKVV